MRWTRVKLTIAFDGTRYAGWQLQKGDKTIQQKVEEAVSDLFAGRYRVHGSSRTDSGVHALGMVAHVDLLTERLSIPLSQLPMALNARLPKDIRIVSAEACDASFHARFRATGKQYRYYLWNHPIQNPLVGHLVWHHPKRLDLTMMREAMRLFRGQHDFAAFAANSSSGDAGSTVRTLRRSDIRQSGPLLTFVMEGDGFLYKMCRGIVGTVVQVGLGHFNVDDVQAMLASQDRSEAGMNAPAKGLVLWKVYYSDDDQRGPYCPRNPA